MPLVKVPIRWQVCSRRWRRKTVVSIVSQSTSWELLLNPPKRLKFLEVPVRVSLVQISVPGQVTFIQLVAGVMVSVPTAVTTFKLLVDALVVGLLLGVGLGLVLAVAVGAAAWRWESPVRTPPSQPPKGIPSRLALEALPYDSQSLSLLLHFLELCSTVV